MSIDLVSVPLRGSGDESGIERLFRSDRLFTRVSVPLRGSGDESASRSGKPFPRRFIVSVPLRGSGDESMAHYTSPLL